MKYIFRTSLLFISLAFVSCSPTTKLVSSWSPPEEDKSVSFDKLAVTVILPNSRNRIITENTIVADFKSNNISAVPTYDVFPMAGTIGEYLADVDREEIKETVKRKIKKNEIDGIMIISLFDVKKEQRYVQGSTFTFGGTGYYGSGYYGNLDMNSVQNGGSYYDYYTYSVCTVYGNGYYTEETTYFIECNLYDTETGNLLWTGQTKTVNFSSIERESVKFAQVIVDELLRKRIISKGS